MNTAYLIRKNFAIGTGLFSYYTQITSLGYSESNNKIAEGKFKSYLLLGVPFLRYYLNPDSKSSLYIQLGAGGGKYIYYNSDYTRYYETGEIYTKSSYNYIDHRIVSIQSFIGLNHFFNENIAFNTGVGFNYAKVEYTNYVINNYPITPNSGTQTFALSSKQKIILWRFGFTFVLGKDKEVKAEKTP